MSNDPKKPLDPVPAETPDLLQRDLNLDRRARRVPSFEELKTARPGAMTEPGIPGPFAQPRAQPQPQAPRPAPAIQPGAPGRPPTHFELAATAQTPQHLNAARPVVTAQPAPPPPQQQPTRAPIAQAPPGLQPRAHAAPTQPHGAPLPRAQPPPAQPHTPQPQAPRPGGPTTPLHANPRAQQPPTAPVRTAAVQAPLPARPPPEATRANVAPRQAPPSPVDWASRSVPMPEAADAPTMPVPVAPRLTAAKPMEGATVPSGQNTPVSYAPAHVPVAQARDESMMTTDEIPTAPNRPVVQRAAPLKPSFSNLPQQMPSHLLMTQPGIPGPYAAKQEPPVAVARDADGPAPPAGPTRVLEPHGKQPAPAQPSTPDFGELPSFEREAPPEPVESVEEATDGDVVAAPASLWRRLLAWVFDLSLIALVVGGFFAGALVVIGRPSLSLLASVALPALGVVGFVAFVYTTLFAFLWSGRTPGRRLFGIHLVDATGHAPRVGRALIRAALSLASFGLFLSGFWLALFDRRGQTLHDKLTSTFVVRLKPAL
ncbi:MAG: RDD family protein [Myxococcaceae bacterium]|nr:RDD family protein [Myxococcaceae bacterium]